MRNLSASMKSALQAENINIAACYKISRKDGFVLGLTDYSEEFYVEGVKYYPAIIENSEKFQLSSTLENENLQASSVLSSEIITETDVLAGLYDNSDLTFFYVLPESISAGTIIWKKGNLGSVELAGGKFTFTCYSLEDRLDRVVGELTSPLCRASLGDSRCGINLISHTSTGSISEILIQRKSFKDLSRTEATGWFDGGKLTFTSGTNNGKSFIISNFTFGGIIELFIPTNIDFEVGDAFTISKGCDKRFETCISKFNNAVNFRGEPHIPGINVLFKVGGQ